MKELRLELRLELRRRRRKADTIFFFMKKERPTLELHST